MRKDIRFGGLGLCWDVVYATSYCLKLEEMGFCARLVDNKGCYLVAYSPLKEFSVSDASGCLAALEKEGNREGYEAQ